LKEFKLVFFEIDDEFLLLFFIRLECFIDVFCEFSFSFFSFFLNKSFKKLFSSFE
jgi:hypothetical protein